MELLRYDKLIKFQAFVSCGVFHSPKDWCINIDLISLNRTVKPMSQLISLQTQSDSA